MKNYLMNLFDLEEGEIESKDVVVAGGSLLLAMGFIFLPLFI
ncbi:hypothetical protein ACQKKE_05420 [Desemzia incerta]